MVNDVFDNEIKQKHNTDNRLSRGILPCRVKRHTKKGVELHMVVASREARQYCLIIHRAFIDQIHIGEIHRKGMAKQPALCACNNEMKIPMFVNIIEVVQEGQSLPSRRIPSVTRLFRLDDCLCFGRHPLKVSSLNTQKPVSSITDGELIPMVGSASTCLNNAPYEMVKGATIIKKGISQDETKSVGRLSDWPLDTPSLLSTLRVDFADNSWRIFLDEDLDFLFQGFFVNPRPTYLSAATVEIDHIQSCDLPE